MIKFYYLNFNNQTYKANLDKDKDKDKDGIKMN